MARPAKFDRKEAVTAAMHAIWKDGLEQSSVKALSDRLGITRSSFYNTFGSREALFREVLPEYAGQSPDAPLHGDVSGEVLPLVTAVFHNICKVRAADPDHRGCMVINAVCELCPRDDDLGADLARMVLGSAERLQQLLDLAKRNGELPAQADPHALALALQNLMIGLNVLCKALPDEEELWLLTKTTLVGLGICRENRDA